jgi:hypothetical protein
MTWNLLEIPTEEALEHAYFKEVTDNPAFPKNGK